MMRQILTMDDPDMGFEWSVFALWIDTNYMYRVDMQSGCSCNDYDPTPESCKPMTRNEVINAYTDWATHFGPQMKTEMLERLIITLNKTQEI